MTAKCVTVVFAGCLVILLGGPAGLAQDTSGEDLQDLRQEIETLKEGQQAIQKALQEIKSLLSTRQAPAPAPPPLDVLLDIGGSPFKGNRNAKLTLIEFTDYQ